MNNDTTSENEPKPDGQVPPYPVVPPGRHPGYGPNPGAQPASNPAAQPEHPGYGPHPGATPPAAYPGATGYPGATAPAPYGAPAAGTAGTPGQPPRKRRLGTGAIVGIVGGGVALIAIVAIVIAVAVNSAVAAREEAAAAPGRAVTAYLTALADGDAEGALALLSQSAEDPTLLTDDVLAASNEIAPISEIELLGQTIGNGSADISVGYLLGDTPVTAEYGVTDYDDDGTWEVTGGLGYLSISSFDGLGLTVNGQSVEGDQVEVFPGTYELATTLPNFTLDGETTVVVTDPFTSADTSGIEPVLTDEAMAEFRSLVKSAVSACIASTKLEAGCGLDLPPVLDDGTQMTDGTITRTLPADTATTLDALEVTLSYENPTLAQGDYIGTIDVEGQCTQAGSTGTCSVLFGPSLGQPSIDMAADDPVVLWD